MRPSQPLRLVLYLGTLVSLPALAAPTTEAPARVEAPQASTAPVDSAGVARPSSRNSDTRTIDMLVEMQQPSAGIQFNERAPRSGSADSRHRPAAPAAAPPPAQAQHEDLDAPPTSPSGLFGSGATPAVQSRNASVMEPSSPRDTGPARAAAGRPSSDVPPEVKRWLTWPRELVDYVRENRVFVAGCAAMLLVMAWTGSVMFSRRRG